MTSFPAGFVLNGLTRPAHLLLTANDGLVFPVRVLKAEMGAEENSQRRTDLAEVGAGGGLATPAAARQQRRDNETSGGGGGYLTRRRRRMRLRERRGATERARASRLGRGIRFL